MVEEWGDGRRTSVSQGGSHASLAAPIGPLRTAPFETGVAAFIADCGAGACARVGAEGSLAPTGSRNTRAGGRGALQTVPIRCRARVGNLVTDRKTRPGAV